MPEFHLHSHDTAPENSWDTLAAVDEAWGFTRRVAPARRQAAEAVPDFLDAGSTKANVLDVVTTIAMKLPPNYAAALTGLPDEDFMSDPALAWTPSMAIPAE